jgi:putative Ca2+/H+ antiporter (TMEM165/GDT1 family)
MAMRYNRIAVLLGAGFALFLMTAISTGFGTIVTTFIPPFYTGLIITTLFFFFGCKLLYEAYEDDGAESNNKEKSEVELELN